MDLLKQLGVFLGWLTGVIAGITAILYALGFVATIAHQGVLGLDWAITSRDALWYLGLGGQVAAHWTFLATLWLMIVLIAGETTLAALRWAETRESRRTRWLRAAAGWIDRRLIWLITVLTMTLAAFMMNAFNGALGVKGLLFASTADLCRTDGVVAELASANMAKLKAHADRVACFAALALGVGGYAVPRLMSGRVAALPLLVCIAVAFNALAAIPTAHGIFLLDTKLRSIVADGLEAGASPAEFRLLVRAQDGIWAWEPETRAVHWFADGSFSHLRIGEAK